METRNRPAGQRRAVPDGALGREGGTAPRWEELAGSGEFRRLIAARRHFIIPAVAFFLVYYFALPLGNGLLPGLMNTKIIGNVNLAYLFALSEFVMAWILAYVYIRRANRVFDPLAAAVRRLADGRGRP